VSISNYESLVANALRRAVRLREPLAVPRVSDLGATLASTAGKIELETAGEGDEAKVIERLAQKAVLTVFNRHFHAAQFAELLETFGRGLTWDVGEGMPAADYERQAARAPGFSVAMSRLQAAGHPARVAAAVEFVLEGLHLNRKLNKDRGAGGPRYKA
jgi:magnesium chelatase subunit I